MEKIQIEYQTSKSERFSYGVYFLGQLIQYGIVTGFLSLFMTESGIPAFVVSGIFLIAKIWDAVNDPMFGVIVDKTKFKRGKYRPWVNASTFLIAITTILIFIMPQTMPAVSGNTWILKAIWVTVAYCLWDISYTMCDVPIFALATSMTDNQKERDQLYVTNRFFSFIGAVIVLVLVPFLYPKVGWGVTSIILSVAALITMIPIGLKAKERHYVKSDKEPKIKELFKYLWNNKPLLIFNGATIVACLSSTAGTVTSYVALYCLGSTNWVSYLSILVALPMLITIVIVQALIKKVDKFKVYVISYGIYLCLAILQYFIGYKNIPIFIIIVVLKSIFSGTTSVLNVMFTADCAEYGHFKTGNRAQGMAFSVQTFTAKITSALSGSIGMFILGLVGFKEGSGAIQTEFTISWIWAMFTIVPVIFGAIALCILLFFFKLKSSDAKIMALCNAGEITKEEAEAQLSRKY